VMPMDLVPIDITLLGEQGRRRLLQGQRWVESSFSRSVELNDLYHVRTPMMWALDQAR
jgi:hypothetical protein